MAEDSIMDNPIIDIKGLTKYYGSLQAVDHLDLSIQKGEIFGLLGPNGAGKSTTILMLLGLTEPSSGSVSICGYDPTKEPIDIKRKVGYMPDSVGFYNDLTALENLSYIGRLNGIPENEITDKAQEMLEMVGLSHAIDNKAGTFSRGMKQRLGLADVLLRDPEIVILDEPTLGLDPAGVNDFLHLIQQLSKEKSLTVLLSSHHLQQVQQVCDRVGIFVSGRLLAQGNIQTLASELFQSEPFIVHVQFLQAPDNGNEVINALQSTTGIKNAQFLDATHLEISCEQAMTHTIVRHLVNMDLDITDVHNKTYGLDEIYQRYFETSLKENATNGKSSGFFQRSFVRKRKQ
ncbi:MAG: ABC transporter ATP-binding protein [Chitinophagaceae bacterium]